MAFCAAPLRRPTGARFLNLARVLVVHDQLPSRLTLQTILRAGGYEVDVAASAAEALAKLDEGPYDLVLTAPELGGKAAGNRVLAYARVKDYRPATSLITAYSTTDTARRPRQHQHQLAIQTENIAYLLASVAELVGMRATRRSERALRQPAAG